MFLKKKFASNIDFLIVGLGNPGREYENTRHNAGFMVVDEIARKLDVKIDRLKFKSLYTIADYKDKKIMLLKPQTFMNLSGEAVVEALQFYKLDIKNTVVICDDINFDVGKLRIRAKGSDGGQNGLKNIIYLSGRNDFARVRVGIGKKPHPDYDLAKWVLSNFKNDEAEPLNTAIKNASSAALMIVDGEIDNAMNRFNK
ncbi:MAG: aminoacyl-tRNA hydrolase [Acutalibacteraceae bacterium]|nr:aminoacyl-tRNA hydrolase [Clostridia bacterium]MEE1144025.1 aminoacyl-tRNA hydrolase [Acutalibacteraceae bacterium]